MKIELPNYEQRNLECTVEVRKREDGGAIIAGMAAVFDKLSENLGGFREIIAPGAFDDTNMDDVRGLWNHDANFIMGRTKSETLRLTRTEKGLDYEIDAPDTRTINDLVVAPIERGDVDQSSFGFIVGRGNDSWDENDDGVLIRTIVKVRELFDVSPVVFPAYQDTTAGTRSMNKFLEQRKKLTEEAERVAEDRRKNGVLVDRLARRAELPSG